MGVPFPGGVDIGGGRAGIVYLCCLTSEHFREIYHNKAHYGPVSGGDVASRISGIEVVVITGGTRSTVYMGGGLCGGCGNGIGDQ